MKTIKYLLTATVLAAVAVSFVPEASAQYDAATNAVSSLQRPDKLTTSGINLGGTWTNIGYLGNATFILNSTNWGGGTPTQDTKLQHSSDTSTWTDVTGGAFAQVTTSNSVQALNLRIQNLKQYIRATNTVTGSNVSNVYSITIVAPQKYR